MNNNENTFRIGQDMAKNSMVGNASDGLWKKVTLGTMSGILLGAGAIQGFNKIKANLEVEDVDSMEGNTPEMEADVPLYTNAPVAYDVSDNMTFDQAFAAARAEVGPGGVFSWHGGIYGTYYETEWDAMSDAQKIAYADSVHPEVTPQHVQVNLINEAHPDVVVDVMATDTHGTRTNFSNADAVVSEEDDDVHIVGQGEVYGHRAAALDLTGDYEADVVVIDADDSNSLTDSDVVAFPDGTATTISDMVEGNPPLPYVGNEQNAIMENPEVAPDMPDYMDDAVIPM